jgi:predicted ArsR family transcriptional regulator
MGHAADQILRALKTQGGLTAQSLAEQLQVSTEAVRQQMERLQRDGLVRYEDRRERVGRPRRVWHLDDKGHGRFPDTHSELSVLLLASIRREFGDAGLERLIARREAETLASYEHDLAGAPDLESRIARLTELRVREGYMAEWRRLDDGRYLLIENHCPICAAATACQGLCRSELQIFRKVLGPEVTVERTEHIPLGARRCAYVIAPAGADAAD